MGYRSQDGHLPGSQGAPRTCCISLTCRLLRLDPWRPQETWNFPRGSCGAAAGIHAAFLKSHIYDRGENLLEGVGLWAEPSDETEVKSGHNEPHMIEGYIGEIYGQLCPEAKPSGRDGWQGTAWEGCMENHRECGPQLLPGVSGWAVVPHAETGPCSHKGQSSQTASLGRPGKSEPLAGT